MHHGGSGDLREGCRGDDEETLVDRNPHCLQDLPHYLHEEEGDEVQHDPVPTATAVSQPLGHPEASLGPW